MVSLHYSIVLQNCDGALGVAALTESLGVHKLCLGRSWHIQPCDAQSGMGLHQGLDWLARQLVPSEVLNSAGWFLVAELRGI